MRGCGNYVKRPNPPKRETRATPPQTAAKPSPRENAESGPAVTDAEALSLTTKHCVMCHAKKPTHESFQEAPKNVTLETLADLKRYAQPIMIQTVRNKAMPLGNQTQMTDEEREQLGRWIRSQ